MVGSGRPFSDDYASSQTGKPRGEGRKKAERREAGRGNGKAEQGGMSAHNDYSKLTRTPPSNHTSLIQTHNPKNHFRNIFIILRGINGR